MFFEVLDSTEDNLKSATAKIQRVSLLRVYGLLPTETRIEFTPKHLRQSCYCWMNFNHFEE